MSDNEDNDDYDDYGDYIDDEDGYDSTPDFPGEYEYDDDEAATYTSEEFEGG
ncbi:hypothetical protein VKT23_001379 [Stygiomarasmius scandens]|uniref:Uncharacterized protein n=1 Tax=Marasmiellus scandens TaxID=2682957 RepID=A0ABR1KAR0_9AGAR